MTLTDFTLEPLFAAAEDADNNACLNWSSDPLELYARAYKDAADHLAVEVMESASHQDTLVYPIVFLYRQYIELRLKEIIHEGRRLLERPGDFPPHHKIDELWLLAREIIEKVFENDDSKPDFRFLQHVISEFSAYDPQSFSFRYPRDKKGNNPLAGLRHINIRHLAESIKRLAEVLDGASMGISVYRDWQNEMYSSM